MNTNNKNGIALRGYDATEFFNENSQKGNAEFSASVNGVSYLFANESNRKKFETDPYKYLPQYGGYCAIAMSEGKLNDPNPKSFTVENGKLYLFTQMLFGLIDAKKQWVKSPDEKRTLADTEWNKIK